MYKPIVFRIRRILPVLLCAALLSGCTGEPEKTRVDLTDAIGGSSIVTAADLLAFLERGESNTARLSCDISMEGEMLCITKARDGLVIDGNGFTISGAGDCVIRLDKDCSITLNNITVHGGSDAIGCLGAASIGGSGAELIGVGNGIRAEGEVTILSGSAITSTASIGTGFTAPDLILHGGASLTAAGPMGGVSVSGEIQVGKGALLGAYTEENYNALKCGDTLSLEDGAKVAVENRGDYHGAEVTDLEVNGAVTIEAKGGKNATGLFLFEQLGDISVMGSCSPKPRFESGKGSIKFVDSPQEIPAQAKSSPEPSPTGEAE